MKNLNYNKIKGWLLKNVNYIIWEILLKIGEKYW
jgi:hypothetical protein